jgi:hypothetical protein
MAANLSCPHCGAPLPMSLFGPGQRGQCPACRSQVEAYVFPEFYRETSVAPAIQLAQEHEAVCYFHARYRATTPCDLCGRFLCQVCAISVGRRQLCAECLSQLRKLRNETGLVQYAALFDNVALFLVAAPVVTVFFSFFTIFSAPVSLFLSFYYWPRQWNLLPRSRLRFAIAILLSFLLIVLWTLAIYNVATSRK